MLKKNYIKKLLFISLFAFHSHALADTHEHTAVEHTHQATSTETLPVMSGIGGDFSATASDGSPFIFQDHYKDHVSLVFFGYTNCADVCPFTLGYLKQVYAKLSPEEQKQVNVIFITIDPEYDTPKHLDEFVKFFNQDFIGVTGNQEKIDEITNLFQATYYKLSADKVKTKNIRRINEKETEDKEEDTGNLYSHSVNIYLIDHKGKTRSIDFTGTDQKTLITKIQTLLSEKNNEDAMVKKGQYINVKDPRTYLSPRSTRVLGGFGEIVNLKDEDIYLIKADAKTLFDHIELHLTSVKDDVAQMVEQENFLIEKGSSLILKHGSYHFMLMQPKQVFKEGDIIDVTLFFEGVTSKTKWQETIPFQVKKR